MRTLRLAPRLLRPAPLLFLLVATSAGPALAADAPDPPTISVNRPCQPNTGVTVIVDFNRLGDHDIQIRCALGEQPLGVDALINAGFDPVGTKQYGLGFVCRLGGFPTAAEFDCESTPGASAYWSYWHAQPGGRWSYSGFGAANWHPELGSIEGWSFSTASGGTVAPRVVPQDSRPVTFVLPPASIDLPRTEREARAWAKNGLRARATEFGGPDLSESELLLWTAGGRATGADAPVSTIYDTAAKVGKAVADYPLGDRRWTPLTARLAPTMLGLIAMGRDPRRVAGVPDLRQHLLALVGPDGRFTPEARLDQPVSVEVAAQAVAALALTGGAPPAAIRRLTEDATALAAEFGERRAAVDVPFTAQLIESLAIARNAGADDLAPALAALTGVLEARQDPTTGRIAAGGNPVRETALAARALKVAGRPAAATAAVAWISRHALSADVLAEAPEGTTPPDLGGIAQSEDFLRDYVAYGISAANDRRDVFQTTLAALAAFAPGTTLAALPTPAPTPTATPAPTPTPHAAGMPVATAPPAPTPPTPEAPIAPATPFASMGPGVPGAATGPAAPTLSLPSTRDGLKALGRRGALRIACAYPGATRCRIAAQVSSRDAKALRTRGKASAGWIVLATSDGPLGAAGRRTAGLQLSAATKRALTKRRRPLSLRVVATATTSGGSTASTISTLRLTPGGATLTPIASKERR